MLEPQVGVNLLPKLGVSADLVRHGYVKDSRMPRECSGEKSLLAVHRCIAGNPAKGYAKSWENRG
jgi:hypothetical protein